MKHNYFPSHTEHQLGIMSANLELLQDRARDAYTRFRKGDYNTMIAELYYLRDYLDRVDQAIGNLGKDNLSKMSK